MKSGSKADRTALRQQLLDAGGTTDDVAAEMRRRWRFRPRESYRHAHGWSQDEVAARFTEVAARLAPGARGAPMVGTRVGEYERWPQGGRRPSPYVLTVLAEVYGTEVSRLLDSTDEQAMPEQDRAVLAALSASATGHHGLPRRVPQPVHPPVPPTTAAPAGHPPAAPAPAGHPSAAHPSASHPSAHPSAGHPSAYPSAAYPAAAYPAAPYPSAYPAAGYPLAGHPQTGHPADGHPPDGSAPAGHPTAYPAAGYPTAAQPRAGGPAAGYPRSRPAPPPFVVAVPTRRLSALADAARMAVPRRSAGSRADKAREAELMAAAATTAVEFGEWAEASSVGPITLEQLDQDVRELARDYLTQAPLAVLRRALDLRTRVFGLLESRLRPAHARELYVLAGKLCGLAAWMIDDLGHRSSAATNARIAGLCADLSDHRGLRGWVRATQSKIAYWDGRPRASAQFAEDGLTLGVTDSGRALLAALAARGWAREGDGERAGRALEQVTREREAVAGPDDVGGVWGFSEAQESYLVGTTHLHLQDPARAAQKADRAVWLFQVAAPAERFYGAESLALLDSAIAHVHVGDLTEAAQRLKPVLALAPDKRVELILRRSSDLRQTVERTKQPVRGQMAELIDHLPEFVSAAAG